LIKTKSFTKFSELGYKLIVHLWAYVVVGILFILFVLMNDGQLVVGDRNAHKATVNLPQLFYFFGLVVIFAAPHWLSQIQPFLKTCLMKWRAILLTTALTAGVIRYNTVVHPYLLADNRHYVSDVIFNQK
jgi:alpha-1,2-glucosyltransferase